ncbi:hypothetical protein MTR67_001451 [Solanum verrucosum]|uniref:Reverse transcriptase zinc-binding domain n=1 Tax=Solanum verrucosum TaxID=315347 RepID=A0AAF0PST5_SOLVR|nr:hypothetical protein MTR67_001451 [Solanum verrucosum]
MIPSNTPPDIISLTQEVTGFSQKSSPISYLGCPMYIGGQRIIYYSELVAKVVKKISEWHSRILSFGGKVTLVKHVLQSIPIHTMTTISPPKTTLNYIKRVTSDFFWGLEKDRKKYHWASWETLSFPYDEGGIGVRNLEDVLSQFLLNGQWNETMIRQRVHPPLVPKILSTNLHLQEGVPDEAVWTANDSGVFSCSSAWNLIRKKKDKSIISTWLWHKHIPFKMSVFLWRAIKSKLPTNERIINFGAEPVNCSCCSRPGLDDIDHILVNGNFASFIWNFFAASVGISHNQNTLRNLLTAWWGTEHKNAVQKLFLHSLPIITCWNLWKNRCSAKYGGKKSSIIKVKFLIQKDIIMLLHIAFPYLQWPEACAMNNPGKIGGGGILRDHQGNMRYAFSIPLGIGSNNFTETLAAQQGIYWCVQHGFKKIIREVDSKLLANWISYKSKPPWQIPQHIRELIRRVRQLKFFEYRHIFGEANSTTNFLAKGSHNSDIIR